MIMLFRSFLTAADQQREDTNEKSIFYFPIHIIPLRSYVNVLCKITVKMYITRKKIIIKGKCRRMINTKVLYYTYIKS